MSSGFLRSQSGNVVRSDSFNHSPVQGVQIHVGWGIVGVRHGHRSVLRFDPPGRYNFGMTPKALADELNRDPFIPLRVRLTDGRRLDIRNPGLCFVAQLALYVFHAKPRDALAEDVQVVSLRNIVSIETMSNGHRGNGSRRKRRS